MNFAVEMQNVTKEYGDRLALDRMSLQIPSNKVTGVLGPNGSGKSTLFKLITGITRPTSGSINVLGNVPGWKNNHNIAYMPDRAGWYENWKIRDVMNWGEYLLPGFNRARAEELLQFMKLDPDMVTHGLSKGEEARMLLTLCISRDVPLLLLDEPFSGIDLISREKIIGALIDVLAKGEQTLIITTHEIYEAEPLFDHVVFIEKGKVKMAGDTEDLRAEYGSMEQLYRRLYSE